MGIHKIDVATGIQWIEVPEAGLRVLCGCPADAVKHLLKRGLILRKEIKGVACETGPNAILLSDLPIQNGEFANLAEFPVLQMLYKQGLILPDHPNNTGSKPLLIGSADQVDAQLRYIYRGNYGLVSQEEMIEAGAAPEQAAALMRMKLAFAFGRIRPTRDFLDTRIVGDVAVTVADGVSVRRLRPNVFEFRHEGETAVVDLNLKAGETYECPYPLGYRRFEPEYFSIIHSGEGDGWDVNRPSMSSILTYQGRIFLIDAGPQLSHTMAALGIGIDQIDGIFHTHAHDDHFAGLTVLMRAGRRIQYFATPLVRASVAKKLTALLGMEEERFADFFDTRDLPLDAWTDIEGLEVMPILSPHPVETSVFVFRTLWGEGYRSYAHFADIVSMKVLAGMVTDRDDQPGLDAAAFERVRTAYATPVDVKKLDIGGGLIHGDAADFRQDASPRILLAHRAGELTPVEKEIGSSAAFGTADVLIAGESDGLRRHGFGYLAAHLPGAPLHQIRMLLNHPIGEINPGAIILKEGEMPQEVILVLSGRVEKLRTQSGLFGNLSAGAFIGDVAILENRPSQNTYRASSFLRVLRLPPPVYAEVVHRNELQHSRKHVASLGAFLNSTHLFGDNLPATVLERIVDGASVHNFRAGEEISYQDVQVLNIIRSGRVERSIGERVMDILGECDFFGEEIAIFKLPYLFCLKALEETTVIQIPGELLEDVPILRWKLLETYQQRAARALHDEDEPDRLHWNEALSVQVARMDRHHMRLIEIANAIIDNLNTHISERSLANVFDALVDYTRHHMEAEEHLIALYGYPGAAGHARKHAELNDQLAAFRERVLAGDVPEKAVFRQFFENWLIRHISDEDRQYGAFLNAKGVY
ncbi:MAG: bacteriohemerythrin [Sterolibacteriaceae bacterium MAG5]|nr:bacteriohemerythrin [Candidatus Nitricoxidireducens bremensis]